MSKTPPYAIKTERLLIRCWQPEDSALLKSVVDRNVDHLRPWLPWAQDEPKSIDWRIDLLRSFRARFDRDEDYIYGIWNREGTKVLGGTGLHTRRGPDAFEIGYWMDQDHTGRGLTTEASAALTQIGLAYCKRDRMEIYCDPENEASAAIPPKLGYTHEVTRRRFDPGWVEGEKRDTMIWTLMRHEYEQPDYPKISLEGWDAAGRQII